MNNTYPLWIMLIFPLNTWNVFIPVRGPGCYFPVRGGWLSHIWYIFATKWDCNCLMMVEISVNICYWLIACFVVYGGDCWGLYSYTIHTHTGVSLPLPVSTFRKPPAYFWMFTINQNEWSRPRRHDTNNLFWLLGFNLADTNKQK